MNGIVLRVMGDKGYGFIKGDDNREYFFHKVDVDGFFDDMVVDYDRGQILKVKFESVPSPKGPRAAHVVRLDNGVAA